jgi:hypothetical protein
MTVRSPDYLKNRFTVGNTPSSADFSDIIDTAYSDAADALTSVLSLPGFVLVEEGSFSNVGGDVFRAVLETYTTASLISLFNMEDANVYVSADFAIQGTAGLSATGTFNTGIQIMLDGSATPGWVSAFNKITTTDTGIITDASMVLSDYSFSYFTSIESSAEYLTVFHPQMASAKVVMVHVSCMSPKSADAPAIRFISSTADAINVDYNSTNISLGATAPYYNTETDVVFRGTVGVGIGDTSRYDITMHPMPNTMGCLLSWATYDVSASAYNIGYGSMSTNADATVCGFRLKFQDGALFNGIGAVRITVI